MYIYLDESYNLKDRAKPQFISINGFKTVDIKPLWKQWKICRRKYLGKARIHGTDRYFEDLRPKALRLLDQYGEALLTVFQIVQEIPANYFLKNKLEFDRIYFDLMKVLFSKLNLLEYRKAVIILDDRKYKFGILGKEQFKRNFVEYLERQYQGVIFDFKIQPSSTDILIEVADFVSNSFYKQYLGYKMEALDGLKSKTIQIKNPLTGSRGW